MISGLWQKLGFWPKDLIKTWKSKKDWIWFHAVSVGELNATWPLILETNKLKPDYPIMISCTTKAGYNLASSLASDKHFLVFFFPFDIPYIIYSLLKHVKVKLLIITETEIWPNTIKICHKEEIPIVLVNARLSDKSFKNYFLFKFYFKDVINKFTQVLAQSNSDGEKFIRLGLEKNKLKILGNIKFAQASNNNGKHKLNNIEIIDRNKTNIIFASTHKGEEEIAINVYQRLLNEFKDLRLIIAPRHIDRINDIAQLIKHSRFNPVLKTSNSKIKSENDILILDTIGDLKAFYSYCQITVLGGTFAKIGGHNILEPIRAKSYTIIGPYDFKIKELTSIFKQNDALVQVTGNEELFIKLKEAIKNKNLRESKINNGLKIIEENSNVLKQTTEQVVSYI